MKSVLLQTPRLVLRSYCAEDAPELYRVASRSEIYATTAFIPHPYPRGRADWWIRVVNGAIRRGNSYELAVTLRCTGQYLGNAGITRIGGTPRTGDITYFIDPNMQGRGYATEATRALIPFAFHALGLAEIHGCCMTENAASRRVMEKTGFSYTNTESGELLKNGRLIDVAHFVLQANKISG